MTAPLDRLQRAMLAYTAWRAQPDRCAGDELLAAHPDLHDLLEPLVTGEEADAADGTTASTWDEDRCDVAPSPAGAPSVDSRRPRQIGPFELLDELGRGAMGVVYRARQATPERIVALKVLPLGAAFSPRAATRFQREANLLGRLDHQGITRVLEVGQDGEAHYFAMELVDGVALSHVLEIQCRDGLTLDRAVRQCLDVSAGRTPTGTDAGSWLGSPLRLAVRIARDVARALAHAHEAAVLHRDVKPSNILLGRDGRVRVTDFGLARERGQPSLTATGEVAGTPYYMAPEQVAGQSVELDGRCDLWALGVTLYQLTTSTLPFDGPSSHEVTDRILRSEPRDPSRSEHGLPPDLGAVLLKCLQKDPQHRYATATELADDLDAVLELRPVRARRTSAPGRLWRWARREPWKAAVALMVGIGVPILAGLGGYAVARQPEIAAGRRALADRQVDRLLVGALVQQVTGDWAGSLERTERALLHDPARTDAVAHHALGLVAERGGEAAVRFLDDHGRRHALNRRPHPQGDVRRGRRAAQRRGIAARSAALRHDARDTPARLPAAPPGARHTAQHRHRPGDATARHRRPALGPRSQRTHPAPAAARTGDGAR